MHIKASNKRRIFKQHVSVTSKHRRFDLWELERRRRRRYGRT